MNGKQDLWFRLFGEVEDDLLETALAYRSELLRSNRWRKTVLRRFALVAAAAVLLVFVLAPVLFLTRGGISVTSVERIYVNDGEQVYYVYYSDGDRGLFTVSNRPSSVSSVFHTDSPLLYSGKGSPASAEPAPVSAEPNAILEAFAKNGELHLTMENGATVSLGTEVGKREKGENRQSDVCGATSLDGEISLRLFNDQSLSLGRIHGGENGLDRAKINADGELLLGFGGGETVNLGRVVGRDGVGIAGIQISDEGEMVVTLTNGTVLNLGNVKGQDGVGIKEARINDKGELCLTYTNGTTVNLGSVKGQDGVGIANIAIDSKGTLTVTLTNGTVMDLGSIKGQDGKSAYELYCEKYGYTGTEEEWLFDLANGNLAEKIYYTVTFDLNGGVGSIAPRRVQKGMKIIAPPPPTRPDSDFLGWYVGDELWSFSGFVVTEDVTLVARWREETHVITYDVGHGANVPENPTSFTLNSHIVLYPPTHPQSLEFLGWYDEGGNLVTEIDGSIARDIHLTARFGEQLFYTEAGTITGLTDYAKNLTEITVPDGVVAIGSMAFSSAEKLEKVTLPDSVEEISDHAFAHCFSLREISLGNGVSHIGWGAFMECRSLEEITLPSTVSEFPDGVFTECYRLRTVYWEVEDSNLREIFAEIMIPQGTVELVVPAGANVTVHFPELIDNAWQYFFVNTTGKSVLKEEGDFRYLPGEFNQKTGRPVIVSYLGSATDLRLPDGIDGGEYEIGPDAFRGNQTLRAVQIPEGARSIHGNAFGQCPALETVRLYGGAEFMGAGIFFECPYLRDVTLPRELTVLPDSMFSACGSLSAIQLPDGLETVGYGAFYRSGIRELTLPESVRLIDGHAFSSSALEFLDAPGVETVGAHAFSECVSLQVVNFSDNLTKVEDYAFAESGIKSLDLRSATHIGSGILQGCHRTESLRIPGKTDRYEDLRAYVTMAYLFGGEDPQIHREIVPDSLKTVAFYGTEVGSHAMYQCSSVQHLTLEAEISRIGEFAFAGCTALEFIGMPWREQAMEIGKDAFLDTVPYRNSAYWKNGILYLENHLIAVRSNPIGSVTVRDGTLSIADGAFAWQTGITSVYLPESVQIIGAGAFEGCTSLIDVTLPDTALRIGMEAFVDTALYLDTSLWEEDVLYVGKHLIAAGLNLHGACTVKEGTLTIAEMAFSNTTRLTSVTLPASLLRMERLAFLNCRGLTTVIFSEGIRQLPEHAFWNCIALETVVLPRSLTSIQSTAFSGCGALECIYYRGSSRAQWNAIGYMADEYTPDDLEILLYSVNKPQDTEGRWHFGTDGRPVAW